MPPITSRDRVSASARRYEGTGRSLSLKLIQQLRQQSADSQLSTSAENKTTSTARLAAGLNPQRRSLAHRRAAPALAESNPRVT